MLLMIQGECVPKGRPRFTKSGRIYTPTKTKAYEELIVQKFMKEIPCGQELPLYKKSEPMTIHVVIGVKIPESYTKKQREMISGRKLFPAKKPDLDNYVKTVCDALNGYAYADDSQIVSISASKIYSDSPFTSVWFERYDTDE